MATMTIRNLDDESKDRLRVRAARHGRSMGEEPRSILRTALAGEVEDSGASLYEADRARVEPLGGMDLELPVRGAMRMTPDLSECSLLTPMCCPSCSAHPRMRG